MDGNETSIETTVNTETTDNNDAENQAATGAESKDQSGKEAHNEELLQAKADLARMKAALDKATKEAGDAKKALRAKQSAEEIAAEEQKAADEATKKELDELRRKVARAETVKTVMSRLGTDEEVSGKVAEYLYGAEDADAALTEIQRAWSAKEKALRLEYGRIPAPGAGDANGEDAEMQKAIKLARELGRERAASGKSIKESLGSYVR